MAFVFKDLLENFSLYEHSPNPVCLICDKCGKTFMRNKKNVINKLRKVPPQKHIYCSRKCLGAERSTILDMKCTQCNKLFKKFPNQIKKSENHFCSRSCAASYNNTHKTHGTRRSKLEEWLEQQLTQKYSNLQIDFNKKDAINSEIDIYIPSLRLAFELNGIFHYEPIYGKEKLISIQNNDNRKFQACLENNIELCILDVSGITYFKPDRVEKYLHIIYNIINEKRLIIIAPEEEFESPIDD